MEAESYQKTKDKMAIGNLYTLIITVNVNSPIKRHRVADWIKKQNPTIHCLQETHLAEKTKVDSK